VFGIAVNAWPVAFGFHRPAGIAAARIASALRLAFGLDKSSSGTGAAGW